MNNKGYAMFYFFYFFILGGGGGGRGKGRYASGELASRAGVFRGARISSLPKYELP